MELIIKSTTLATLPTGHNTSYPVWIDDDEIAYATDSLWDTNASISDGIWIYNTNTNKWRLHVHYPRDFESERHHICYNKKTKILWVYGDYSKMININMETKQVKIIKAHAKHVGIRPVLLFIKDKLHVIGGSDSKNHLVWNNEKNQFDEPIFTFPELTKGVTGHKIVHLKKKNILYLFGGYGYGGPSHIYSIWKCDINENFKWSKLDLKLKRFVDYNACVATSDEKCIGGHSGITYAKK